VAELTDVRQLVKQLGLGAEAGPLEVLAVSGGGRTGDTYELTPLPNWDLSACRSLFTASDT
jgi:hypothetical protein